MPDNKLTLEAEAQIRRYLWKILGPAGGLAGLFLFGMGWLINDLARGTAYNDALAIFHEDMTKIAVEVGKSAADAERAKKNAEDARIEIFRIRDDVKTATITKILRDAAATLSNDPNFVTKVQEEIGHTLDLTTPKTENWTQKRLQKIGDPKIRDFYDEPILWHDGTKIHNQQGLCFLTKLSGKFEGAGEYVEVYIGKGNYWHFKGNSHQGGVAATVICYKLKLANKK